MEFNKDNTVVFSHWRSGTNALASIFREVLKFYYLDDYHLQLGIESVLVDAGISDELAHKLKSNYYNRANKYIQFLSIKTVSIPTLLKIMPPTIPFITEDVLEYFPTRILLYRKDLYAMIRSYAIALQTGDFVYRPEQPDVCTIDKDAFKELCESTLCHIRMLMTINISITHVFEYDQDLVPYLNNNPTSFKRQNYVSITNEEEIIKIYDDILGIHATEINYIFDSRRDLNIMSFRDLIRSKIFKPTTSILHR